MTVITGKKSGRGADLWSSFAENRMLPVKTSGLAKEYVGKTAVKDLRISVRRGEVYGLLGPNGSGKTTTLKMILGLIRPTSGEIQVLGQRPGNSLMLTRTGALIESPAFYPYLSGRDNLRVIAYHSGALRSQIDTVLETVELFSRAKDKYKNYSLGMKQRLGVAAALLNNPELLVLDEPTNGLDPKGMADMRTLIRRLGQGDRTVLLSSHLLWEIEQICDRVSVINNGKLVAEGTVKELKAQEGLLIRAEPVEYASQIASLLAGVEKVQTVDEGAMKLTVDPNRAAEIVDKLVSAELKVSEVRPIERSLEEAFLELTREEALG